MIDITPTQPVAQQRINERLLAYWASLKEGRAYPFEQDIIPEAIDDIWQSCFLVKVEERSGEPAFVYSFLGEDLIEAYGDDMTGHEICETLVYPASDEFAEKLLEVVNDEAAVVDESEFTNSQGLQIKSRSCLLPLGEETQEGVRYIIGGMKWRAF